VFYLSNFNRKYDQQKRDKGPRGGYEKQNFCGVASIMLTAMVKDFAGTPTHKLGKQSTQSSFSSSPF
jgi:hypothetical protein